MTLNSVNISLRVLLPILEELATPRSLTVAIMLRAGDLEGLLSLKTDPRHYVDAGRYYRDVQAVGLLKKLEGWDVPGVDRRKAALKKWLDGEYQCYKSNERLSKFNYGAALDPADLAIFRIFRKVRKTIASWIGTTPPDLDASRRLGRFGPGATFADRGRWTTVADKMTSTPTLTGGAAWYTLPFLQTSWGRVTAERHRKLSWVRGNRYLTVPKTGLIDRSIAVEPSINVFFQLALGSSLRNRLRNATGWDLDRAQDVHRAKARESSITREFATLDLSNASDTVSIELVRLLLPPLWFEELQALRSPFTYVDGKWRMLEKFSSMGNGYTFELETLIFAAICSVSLQECGHEGLLGRDLFVFGDDIIVPDDSFSQVCAVLKFCGLSINEEKSFSGGVPFRESCGGDFYNGVDVRPFSFKREKMDPWDMIPDVNGVYRITKKLAQFGPVSSRPLDAIMAVIPIPVRRCFGPEALGDIVLHTDDPHRWSVKWKHCIRYVRAVVRVDQPISWSHWHPHVVLACATYGTGDGYRGVTPRGSLYSYKLAWVPYS